MAEHARRQRRRNAGTKELVGFEWRSHLEFEINRAGREVATESQKALVSNLFDGKKWDGKKMKRLDRDTIERKRRAAAPFPAMIRTGDLARSLRGVWIPSTQELKIRSNPRQREKLRAAYRSRRRFWTPTKAIVQGIADDFIRAGVLVEKRGAP